MGKRLWGVLILLVCLGALVIHADCVFGPNRYYGVMSHRGNRIFIRHDRWYYVGKLPDGWQDLTTGVRSASWYSADYFSTISTEVLCERSTGDRPLASVAAEVASAIEDRTVTEEGEFMLDGRGALRQRVSGSVDGVPLIMDVVVVKKNNCAFDFVAIAPPDEMPNISSAFEVFFNGFHYDE
jgi:hypothetical protein